jgi:sulfur carrier protein
MQDTVPLTISILVNGEDRVVRQGETVAGLVRALDLDSERLAIELNRCILKRAQWDSTVLDPGARLEIVQFVGGG